MLCTELTVMYTVDSLFLRMFCFCAQRPVFTAVRLLITLNSRLTTSGGAKVIDGLGSLTDQNQGN